MGEIYMRFKDGSEIGIDRDGTVEHVFETCDRCQKRQPRNGGRMFKDAYGEPIAWLCRTCLVEQKSDTPRT